MLRTRMCTCLSIASHYLLSFHCAIQQDPMCWFQSQPGGTPRSATGFGTFGSQIQEWHFPFHQKKQPSKIGLKPSSVTNDPASPGFHRPGQNEPCRSALANHASRLLRRFRVTWFKASSAILPAGCMGFPTEVAIYRNKCS